MIENGHGFQLASAQQPLLDKPIGQHITGLQRDDGTMPYDILQLMMSLERPMNKRSLDVQT